MTPSRPVRPLQAVALGTLAVGILDITFAIVRAGMNGVPAARVMQSIAAGLLGKASYQGGAATVLLGTLLHFFIAGMVVLVYFLASRRVRALAEQPVLYGALYGLVVFAVMNFVVIPLSALAPGPRTLARMVPGILVHLLGVGLPAAFAARAVPLAGTQDA